MGSPSRGGGGAQGGGSPTLDVAGFPPLPRHAASGGSASLEASGGSPQRALNSPSEDLLLGGGLLPILTSPPPLPDLLGPGHSYVA